MKKACLEDWLTALRSGNYTKCVGGLHRNDGFCPLGILCDISKLDTWSNHIYINDKKTYLGQSNYLPEKVREWAGINQEEYNSMSSFVLVFNDYEKVSLIEMADLLEKKYKKKN